ncbi:MAG TPA: phosphatase PAP2 family protein [Usitatibacter sp.]|nr:phosphatase PAP2 family protein [Usitatibacter sp.]
MRLPDRPHSLSPRALAIAGWSAFLVAGALFMAVAWNVAARESIVVLDERVTAWWETRRSPPLTTAMLALTHAHSLAAIAAWSAVLALALARLRERYWILTLALAVGGGMALNGLLKLAYERARPHLDDPILTLATFSFPSGHTAAATTFYGVLAAFLVSRLRGGALRSAVVLAAMAMVALVGLSRVYLGAHFLSDVLAAACSSTVWLVLCLAAGHDLARRRRSAAPPVA